MAKARKRTKLDDVFDTDTVTSRPKETAEEVQPLFRVYEGSRIAVGKAVGPAWESRFKAAQAAQEATVDVWNEVIRYYNNDQNKTSTTPKGTFTRGDDTENVIYSNVNVMMPAIYGKDPQITCNTTDTEDQDFCKAMESIINTLFKRRDKMYVKPKVKKAAGMTLLTNCGVLKIDYTKKEESREHAIAEMSRISNEMEKAEDQATVDKLYGQLEALEKNLDALKPGGAALVNVKSTNLWVDPYAEQPDGLDGNWMIERAFISTAFLNAEFAKEGNEDDNTAGSKVLVYKPTHKASFDSNGGTREDGMGMVLQAIGSDTDDSDDRQKYIDMYFTECYWVWDRMTRRVMLFQAADWTWPVWVWDDELKLTRFFPYFLISFGMSTGGTISVGEMAYVLDQQDAINEINRELAKIRRSVFNFFFFNSDSVDPKQAEKFINAVMGKVPNGKNILGIKAGEGQKIDGLIQALAPPSMQYKELFDKESKFAAINRITNTNDALRGVQFKTNTTEDAVQTYNESMRLSVGAKVDTIEDVVADIAGATAELVIQNMTEEEAAGLVGKGLAKGYRQMSMPEFLSTYSLEVVAGSMEKPNSVFKKKEAVQVCQAVGQFASAAPAASLMIMLRVLSQAFSEVVIKPEDWDMLKAEAQANLQKGVSTGGETGGDADPQAQLLEQAKNLPDNVKAEVMAMKERGADPQEILAFIQQQVKQNGSAQPEPESGAATAH